MADDEDEDEDEEDDDDGNDDGSGCDEDEDEDDGSACDDDEDDDDWSGGEGTINGDGGIINVDDVIGSGISLTPDKYLSSFSFSFIWSSYPSKWRPLAAK